MQTIAEFMQEAMYGENGYYIKSNPVGKDGDFITAPEISQLFGEMIGVYCAQTWINMGQPKRFALVELGPGKATLMLDLLRATKNIPNFHQSFEIHLVECNLKLIELQQQKLTNYPVTWHRDISTLPNSLPMIIVANEFFDCLPINQYIKRQDGWYERHIDFVEKAVSLDLSQEHPNAKIGDIVEKCYPAFEIIKSFTDKLKQNSGHLLIIDYGYDLDPLNRQHYGDTLQAIKNHQFSPVFENIGNSDLTAHVDFFALKQIALASQCNVMDSITQGCFLQNLGIKIRAEMLKQYSSIEQRQVIDSELYRLIDDKEMGKLFRVLEIFL